MPQAEIRCLVNEGHHARTYRKGAWAAPNGRWAAVADKRMRAGSYYQQMAGFINL